MPAAPRTDRARARRAPWAWRAGAFAGALAGALALLSPSRALAQGGGGVLLQGIVDGEYWSTNATSSLLTRNGGRPGGVGQLQLWGAYEPISRLVLYAQGDFQGGPARVQEEYEVYDNQFGIRYIASPAFVVDAGRFTPVVGTFAERHLATRNPLIGQPDGYAADYPLGVKVSGEARGFDYRAGLVTLPMTHVQYEPTPSARLRPAIGGGYSPIIGLRFGASFTVGPYLSRGTPAADLAGRDWTAYQQRVAAFDAEFAHGYLETHFEAARGSYDVVGSTSPVVGFTYYGEAKYTFTPRFFLATRLERNKYPFIRPDSTGNWTARLPDFADGELGAGYRLTSSTLLKASMRADRWWFRSTTGTYRPADGHAFAMQVSQTFDVMNWVDRARLR